MNNQLLNATFYDIHTSETGGQKVFSFRTGMSVYEEVLLNGRYMSAGWNIAGYTLDVLESYPTRIAGFAKVLIGGETNPNQLFRDAQAFYVELDGVSLDNSWEFVNFEKNDEVIEGTGAKVIHGKLTLKSTKKPVEVVVHTILDGTPIMTRWIDIKNNSDANMNLSGMSPICGGIEAIDNWQDYVKGGPDPEKIYSLGYMDNATWGREGAFRWRNLPNNSSGFSGKRYHDQCYRHPFYVLENKLLGNMMIAQLAWTGGYEFSFRLDTDTTVSKLGYNVSINDPSPMLVLEVAESFSMPAIHIGMLHGDLDDAINSMHKHTRKTVFTHPSPMGKKGWVEGGMGCERVMDMKAAKHFIDTVAEIGAEIFIIDSGWYCPPGKEGEWYKRAGDWHHNPERFPNGLKEVRDYARSKGLKFGLWVEIEAMGNLAETVVSKEHPEWISKSTNEIDRLLDMTNPEVVEWAENELSRVIEEYQLDLFRIDFNMRLNFTLYYNDKNGVSESSHLRYYKNVIAMLNRLKKKYPDVVFENCASGGERTDLAFVKNFTHSWVSDWQIPPRSFTITNGMTMVLPPETVDRLVSGMNSHTKGSLDFQARNTIFGRPTSNDYNCMGSISNPDQLAFVKHTFDIYKKHIRPFIDQGLIYHHTPDIVSGHYGANGTMEQPQGIGILERGTEDSRHGVIGIFKLADSKTDDFITVYPKGIDPSLTYMITLDNLNTTAIMSGMDIYQNGIKVKVSPSLASELIIYEAK